MATKTAVPSSAELELADYKYGSFSSDLDVIESAVKHLLNPMTPEEYLALDASGGLEAAFAAFPHLTPAGLAPLLLFAANVEEDAHELLVRAEALRSSVLCLVNSARDKRSDPDAWERRESVIAEWHSEQTSDNRRDES